MSQPAEEIKTTFWIPAAFDASTISLVASSLFETEGGMIKIVSAPESLRLFVSPSVLPGVTGMICAPLSLNALMCTCSWLQVATCRVLIADENFSSVRRSSAIKWPVWPSPQVMTRLRDMMAVDGKGRRQKGGKGNS
jgi:hypothetical protein